MSGANNIGILSVTGGTIRIGAGGSLGNTFVSLLDGGGAPPTLDLDGNDLTIESISGDDEGRILLGSGTLTLTDARHNFSGDISGSGNLVKNGAGTLTLRGDKTFTERKSTSLNSSH